MEPVKRLKRELVQKGSIIDYYKDTVQVQNGNIAQWDFIKHKGAAAVIPVTDDGKLLMVRQYRNALDRATIEIPAGGKEPDEDFKTCARRELEEETGYASDDLEFLISTYTTVAFCNEQIDIYVAKNLKKTKQNLDPDEFVDVEAFDIKELLDMIYAGTMQDGKTIAGLMAYAYKFCR